jgi:hypothetical protein
MRRGAARRAERQNRPLTLEHLESRDLLSGVWTPLVNTAPTSIGTMMLLTDGTVMAEAGGQSKIWYQLTPDSQGNYANGTWSTLASMHFTRLYFGSNVLPDGRAWVQGGEYSSGGSFTRTGEIYDPVADTWTDTANFPLSQFGDDPTVLLQDGRVLTGYLAGPQTYLYDPSSDTWTQTGSKLANDQSDEETWLMLPDGSVLTYDVFNNGHSQRYIPSSGTWVDAGTVPVNLSSSSVGFEMGPAALLQDGRALFVGATNHTALYDPSSNSWTAGPDMPAGMGADDAPGAMLPNGHFIFAADHPLFHGPTSIFDFDPSANTLSVLDTSGVGGLGSYAYGDRMLELPTQQVLLTTASSQLYIYTPDEQIVDPSLQPAIADIQDNGDGTFTLTGTQLNGVSAGSSYGDDAEMDSNYPVISLTDADGNVSYARTFNWNPGLVQSGSAPVSTDFTLPAGLVPGDYNLQVSAGGIVSDPVVFTVNGPSVNLGGLRLGNGSTTAAATSQTVAAVPASANYAANDAGSSAMATKLMDQSLYAVESAQTALSAPVHRLSLLALDAAFSVDELDRLV